MRTINKIILSAAVVICMSGCSNSSGKKFGGSLSDLTGKYWKLTQLYGQPFVKDSLSEGEPHIIFKLVDRSLTGNGGCNSLYARFTTGEKNKLTISDLGSTKMACDNMNSEMRIFDALRSASNWLVNKDTLWLRNIKSENLARFIYVAGK